ncbi:MAG: aldo/keto reductase [Hyphomicrobiales bacterium]|nr:aldo/keto reductase [Hyphomicrobiales bacterium]
MKMRALGRTGIQIAPLVLGGNVFGWTADEKTSFAVLDSFAEAGCNAVDTADVYSSWAPGNKGGESETIIGKWMKARGNRNRMVVITKVGSDMGGGRKGLGAAYIEKAVDASLQRLGIETIDLYLSHWPDAETPYTETLGAYEKLLQKGKVRAVGASNLDANQLREALTTARERKLPRYAVLQPEYNLYDRSGFEGALQDLCIKEEIGVITYFGLAKGFLTGKYREKSDLAQSQRGEDVADYMNPRGMQILEALDQVAKRHNARPAEVALAWVMAQPGVTAPIASATSVEQVRSLVRAASLNLEVADLALLSGTGPRQL